MGNFLVRYASRVVIYDRRAVIRLATYPCLHKPFEVDITVVDCLSVVPTRYNNRQ